MLNTISQVSNNPSFIVFVLVGFIAFSFFLLPGISGSAILLSIGVYEIIIGSIANMQLEILMPFAIGCLISLLLMPKIINHLLSKYKLNIMIFFAALILVSGVLTFPNWLFYRPIKSLLFLIVSYFSASGRGSFAAVIFS